MPVWPFLMAVSAGLALWGWRHDAWLIPALALLGYIAMRLNMIYLPPVANEVAGCTLWLFFAAAMVYKGGAVPGLFFALSALTYPVLLVFGFRVEYMGLIPIIADGFAVLALLSIGGGLYGISHMRGDNNRPLAWVQSHSVGVALRQKDNHRGF